MIHLQLKGQLSRVDQNTLEGHVGMVDFGDVGAVQAVLTESRYNETFDSFGRKCFQRGEGSKCCGRQTITRCSTVLKVALKNGC